MQVFIVSMLVCAILILLLRRVAHRLDIVDRPGGRKHHEHPTPTVGGLAMFMVGGGGTITHLGAMFGRDIPLGMFAVPFSVIAFVGGINAINMIDGADGMAGTIAFV